LHLFGILWVSGADQGICTSFEGVSFVEKQLFYIGDHALVRTMQSFEATLRFGQLAIGPSLEWNHPRQSLKPDRALRRPGSQGEPFVLQKGDSSFRYH
jgi:hypothetical protein